MHLVEIKLLLVKLILYQFCNSIKVFNTLPG